MSSRLSILALGLALAATWPVATLPACAQDVKKEEKKEPAKEEKKEERKEELIALKNGSVKVEDALKADDVKDEVQKQPCKVYIVQLKKGQNYKIDMTSKELDSYLRLEDAAGKQLAKDDDSGGSVHARIYFHSPADGRYRIICTTFYASSPGAFTLAIQESAIAMPTPLPLTSGAAKVEGKLSDSDPKDTVQTRSACQVYAVNLTKGRSYQIDMTSRDVDSFLRLEDATGKELAKDDDSGGGRNARIQFTCPDDGEYRIIATTDLGGVGSFMLTIKPK